MQYPESMKPGFTGEKQFVELNGDAIWEEVCDIVPTGTRVLVAEIAPRLKTLRGYAPRIQKNYLSAVLKCVYANWEEKQKYEIPPPFRKTSSRIQAFIM